jgi:uncharacterized membrane protein YeaQ/YmgE (transglycosylase-associated protein family)
MGSESVLMIIVIGGVAGWLAGLLLRGSGYGIIGDVVVGLIGAFIGNWLFRAMHVSYIPQCHRALLGFTAPCWRRVAELLAWTVDGGRY